MSWLPFLLLSACLLWLPKGKGNLNVAILGLLVFSFLLIAELVNLWRSKIEFTNETISGRVGKFTFKLSWLDVLAIWESSIGKRRLLQIGTQDQGVSIPLELFDRELLIDSIRHYVPQDVMMKDSYKQLASYKTRQFEIQTFIEQVEQPLRVGMRFLKWLGWICSVIFLAAALASWRAQAGWPVLFFLMFAALGIAIILGSGTVKMTRDLITYSSPIGCYRIAWDEVAEIEMDLMCGNIVFNGLNKRLLCNGPACWSGEDKEKMVRFLIAQIENRKIVFTQTQRAMWRMMSRNTRVRK